MSDLMNYHETADGHRERLDEYTRRGDYSSVEVYSDGTVLVEGQEICDTEGRWMPGYDDVRFRAEKVLGIEKGGK